MAPDRPESKRLRWFLIGAVAVLTLLMILLLGINYSLRKDLDETRTRLTALEVKDLAEDASRRTAEVATCYATARSRPGLIVILNLISGLAVDSTERSIVNAVIASYQDSAPTLEECGKRARENGLRPEEFPPVNRGEEGNGR